MIPDVELGYGPGDLFDAIEAVDAVSYNGLPPSDQLALLGLRLVSGERDQLPDVISLVVRNATEDVQRAVDAGTIPSSSGVAVAGLGATHFLRGVLVGIALAETKEGLRP